MANFSVSLPLSFSPSVRLRSSQAPTIAPPAVVEVALDSIAIFMADAVVEGWTERSPTRPSDKLNRGLPIDIRYSPAGAAHPMDADDVIALAVQPQPHPSPNRVARRRHVLEMTAGPYSLRGIAHMPPGADPQRYLRAASQRWIALTKATIEHGDDGEGYEIDVLLVNMEHVSRV